MTTIEARRETFDMGRVITRTFGSIGRNSLVFFVLAVVLVGAPTFGLSWLQLRLTGFSTLTPGTPLRTTTTAPLMAFTVAFPFVRLFLSSLLQAALVHGVISDLNGRRPGIGECLSTGLRYAVPVIAISFLYGLGIVFGIILLVVPGLMLLTAWVVAVPAEIADRTGVFGAFSRSAELTRGSRWAIFGLMVIFGIVAFIIQMVIMGVLFGVAGFGGSNIVAAASGLPMMLATAAISVVSGTLGAAGAASIYCELRAIKEGAVPSTLAAVFD